MIAIGGVIGTGLFFGIGSDLENGGPAGLLLGYLIMASLLYSVMTSLGEMISQFPIPGGQFALAGRFVSPELGFALGWIYWLNFIIVVPAELSAASVLISYWTPASQADSTCTTGICSNAMWVALMVCAIFSCCILYLLPSRCGKCWVAVNRESDQYNIDYDDLILLKYH